MTSLVKLKKQLDDLPRGGSSTALYVDLIKSITLNETLPKHRLANMIKHFARSSNCKVQFTKHDDTELVEFVKNPTQRTIVFDDSEQSKRFIETAEEVGADDEKTLKRGVKKNAPNCPKQRAKPVLKDEPSSISRLAE